MVRVERRRWIDITDFAQDALDDVVGEAAGRRRDPLRGQTFVVESNKTVSDLFAPVAGRVVAVNQVLRDEPELVNQTRMPAG